MKNYKGTRPSIQIDQYNHNGRVTKQEKDKSNCC